jgi:general stress protein 26
MNHDAEIKKFSALIKDVKFAMLTSVDSNGKMHSCPMTTQQTEFDGSLWFFISKKGHKMADMLAEPSVNLSYSKPDDQVYVSVTGTAELVEDREKAEELWSPMYKAWFKDGLEDPDLGLLKVDVEKAEYWDAPGGGVAQLIGFAKAMLTGQKAKVAEHEKINLR